MNHGLSINILTQYILDRMVIKRFLRDVLIQGINHGISTNILTHYILDRMIIKLKTELLSEVMYSRLLLSS